MVLTFGCQCNSLNPFGSSVTIAAAMVVAMGKLRESTFASVPPPPGAGGVLIWDNLYTYELLPCNFPYGLSTLAELTLLGAM